MCVRESVYVSTRVCAVLSVVAGADVLAVAVVGVGVVRIYLGLVYEV